MACEYNESQTRAADGGIRGGYHVVCLIDVLGQKAKLAKWAQAPPSLQPTPEFMTAIEESAGTVLRVRQMFEEYFRLFAVPGVPAALIDSLPREKKDFFWRTRDCRLKTQQFSDSFVLYAPILNAHDDRSAIPLYGILTACCTAMTYSLASGFPLRGAVCIGMGLELAERNFYGPALGEAHYLESKVAEYPRIVVSAEATKFAQSSSGFSQDGAVNAVMRDLAVTCCSLLCEDADRRMIVDFLGKGACSLQGGAQPNVTPAIENAYRFVRAEALRFRQAGNEKLAPRYALLQKYMDARLPFWGLQHLAEVRNAR